MKHISMILASDLNGCIGRNGKIPWNCPTDMRRFRRITMGHTVLMGRKTYESVPVEMRGRKIIVLTSKRNYKTKKDEHITIANSAQQATHAFKNSFSEKMFVCGGAGVYSDFLDKCEHVHLTTVGLIVEDGDTFFDVRKRMGNAFEIVSTEIDLPNEFLSPLNKYCIYKKVHNYEGTSF